MSVVNGHPGPRAEQARCAHGGARATGFESRHRLTLVLERDDGPRPKARVFLDRSEEDSGATNLFVESKTGNVLVLKGEDPVDVFIKDVWKMGYQSNDHLTRLLFASRTLSADDRYSWHCGSHDSDDSSNAPDATNVAVTRRAATGGKITWTWYSERTLNPDLQVRDAAGL